MYEARRQRSSWARIKLSIVRKFMSIVWLRLAIKLLDFAYRVFCPIIAFWINKFLIKVYLILVFTYSVFNVQSREVDFPWFEIWLNLKSGSTSFAIYFRFQFRFCFCAQLSEYSTSFSSLRSTLFPTAVDSQPRFPTLCALGGFLTDKFYLNSSIFIVN